MTKSLILTLLALCCFTFSYSNHFRGSEITFEHVKGMKYLVTYSYYRNCDGFAMGNPSYLCHIRNKSGTKKQGISLTRQRITDVTNICTSQKKPCNPSNTSGTGKGVEEHVYQVTIDFSKAPYSYLITGNEALYFVSEFCCRLRDIKNGSSNKNQYNYAMLNIRHGANSTPKPLAKPIISVCCNQPVYYSFKSAEERDGDSISYALVNPLKDFADPISMTKPWFKVYYPNGVKFPYSNPKGSPPVGISLDPANGSLIFTPIKCGDLYNIVLEATAWKKDTSGIWHKSAVMRRDQVFDVIQCSNNNPPVIEPEVTPLVVCEGDLLTHTIDIEDRVKRPPPPAPSPNPDKVTVTVIDSIAGASVKSINTGVSNFVRMRFSWRPKIGEARKTPYSFTLMAQDDACPVYIPIFRTFEILVKPKPTGSFVTKELSCNQFELTSLLDSSFNYPSKYHYDVLDTSGQILGIDYAYFQLSNAHTSSYLKDTLHLRKPGTFYVRFRVENGAGCSDQWVDTIQVSIGIQPLFSKVRYTFCAPDSIRLMQDLHPMSTFNKFVWSDGSTDTSLLFKLPDPGWETHFVSLKATPASGCSYLGVVEIVKSSLPTIKHSYKGGLCTPIKEILSVEVLPIQDSAIISWNDSVTPYWPVNNPGTYRVKATNSCGSSSDSIVITEWFKPDFDLSINGYYYCDANVKVLNPGLKNKKPEPIFRWDGHRRQENLPISGYSPHTLTITNACGFSTESIQMIGRKDKPIADLGNDTFLCHEQYITLRVSAPDAKILWWNGIDKEDVLVFDPQVVWVQLSNPCGTSIDTVNVLRIAPPTKAMPSDTFYCKGDDFHLDAGNKGSTYFWDDSGDTSRVIQVEDPGPYRVRVQNKCGVGTYTTNVIQKTIPIVDLGADTVELTTGTVKLDAGNEGSSFLWNTNAITQAIRVNNEGWYWVQVTNECGLGFDSVYLKVIEVGVVNLTTNHVQVYPNPTTGVVEIVPKSSYHIKRVRVFNALGQEVKDIPVYTKGDRLIVALPKGDRLLFLRIEAEDGETTIPILVESE